MASDTFANTYYAKVCQNPSGEENRGPLKQVAEAGILPTYIVRESSETVLLCKSTDKYPYGVVADMPGKDLDTAFTITTDFVECFEIGSGQRVLCTQEAASPAPSIVAGWVAVCSATDGQVAVFAYTNASEATDTLVNMVGRYAESKTGSTSDTKLVKVNI